MSRDNQSTGHASEPTQDFVSSLFSALAAISQRLTSSAPSARSIPSTTTTHATAHDAPAPADDATRATQSRSGAIAVATAPASDTASDSNTTTFPRDLPPEAKEILLTLHVLFPHHLLDALDLLDRGLVRKVVLRDDDDEDGDERGPASAPATGSVAYQHQGLNKHLHQQQKQHPHNVPEKQKHNTAKEQQQQQQKQQSWSTRRRAIFAKTPIYFARSTQPAPGQQRSFSGTNAHRYHDAERREREEADDGEQGWYSVRLFAWNCTCAAFTFACFAAYASGASAGASAGAGAGNGDGAGAGAGAVEGGEGRAGVGTSERASEGDGVGNEASEQGLQHDDNGHDRDHDYKLRGDDNMIPPRLFGGISAALIAASPSKHTSNTTRDIQQQQGPEHASVPLCKHLLAALLAETAPGIFAAGSSGAADGDGDAGGGASRGFETREMSVAEMAGYASFA